MALVWFVYAPPLQTAPQPIEKLSVHASAAPRSAAGIKAKPSAIAPLSVHASAAPRSAAGVKSTPSDIAPLSVHASAAPRQATVSKAAHEEPIAALSSAYVKPAIVAGNAGSAKSRFENLAAKKAESDKKDAADLKAAHAAADLARQDDERKKGTLPLYQCTLTTLPGYSNPPLPGYSNPTLPGYSNPLLRGYSNPPLPR